MNARMPRLLMRLKQRKLVQWAIAYVAFAFALIQVIDVVAGSYDWPHLVMHLVFGTLVLGFVVVLVLAWYHGERGAQHVSGAELLLIALAFAIGGGLLWHFGTTGSAPVAAHVAATHDSGAGRPAAGARTASTARAVASVAPRRPIPAKSIAVLPFENLSNDETNAYFASGMRDLILAKLSGLADLKVISRTSSMQYASRPTDLRTVGRELGAATILEGSVQKQGKQVLITVQLIDARSDTHLWAQSYMRKLDDIFGVEGEMAATIAAELRAELSPAESRFLATAPTRNPAAYDLFLRAEYFFERAMVDFDTSDWRAAVPLYKQAIQEDPTFALAFAKLAYTESALSLDDNEGPRIEQLERDARAHAGRALALAPNLPAAHVALGYCEYHERQKRHPFGPGAFDAAVKAFDAALKLSPNDADALQARGYVLRRTGRLDAAIVSFGKAFARDPRNSGLARELGTAYMMAMRYPEAERVLRRATALDPENDTAPRLLAYAILFGSGDVARALASAPRNDAEFIPLRVALLVLQRKYRAALALSESSPRKPDDFERMLRRADLYRWMGDRDRANRLYADGLRLARAYATGKARSEAGRIYGWTLVGAAELGLGHRAAGMAAIDKSQALVDRVGYDPFYLQYAVFNAELYARAGRADRAGPLIDRAFATKGIGAYYSPAMLWLSPDWDPIRADTRFQALLQKYARYKPAVTYPVPASAAIASGIDGA